MELAITLLPLLLIIVVMYMFMIRPQRKKEKQIQAMRSSLQVGDKVVTIGGFYGTIVKTRDEVLTLQMGSDKNKVEIMRWGISRVEEEAVNTKAPAAEKTVEKKALPKKMKKKSSEPADSSGEDTDSNNSAAE